MNIFTKKDHDRLSNEEHRKMALELANSYLNIAGTFAWKDLSEYLDKLGNDAIKECEECATKDLTLVHVGKLRGIREVINKIKKHVDFSVNAGPRT